MIYLSLLIFQVDGSHSRLAVPSLPLQTALATRPVVLILMLGVTVTPCHQIQLCTTVPHCCRCVPGLVWLSPGYLLQSPLSALSQSHSWSIGDIELMTLGFSSS